MANLTKVLKDEIQRIARREVKQSTEKLRKDTIALKRLVNEQKRKIVVLENRSRRSAAQRVPIGRPAAAGEKPAPGMRVTAKALKSLRSRLDISQQELAKLIGASTQSVSNWETSTGRLQVRKDSAREALAAVKRMKKKDVWEKLGKQAKSSKTKTAPRRKTTAKAG